MPSVMTMASGICASIASMTAALAPAGGTKITEVSAPVAAIVSATVPKTGSWASSRSTVWPALRGLVPPTTVVPAASIRRPCLLPSEPVMPWIMTRLSPVRKIAMSCSCRGRLAPGGSQFGRPPRGIIHRLDLLDHGQSRVGQDAAALRRVVAIQPDHDRVAHLLPPRGQHGQRRHDAVGNLVARGDATEHIDQHAADRGVRQHDLQAVRHHLAEAPPPISRKFAGRIPPHASPA